MGRPVLRWEAGDDKTNWTTARLKDLGFGESVGMRGRVPGRASALCPGQPLGGAGSGTRLWLGSQRLSSSPQMPFGCVAFLPPLCVLLMLRGR